MKNKTEFKRIIVPVVFGCDYHSALTLASAIASDKNILIVGLVRVPEADQLSKATSTARRLRALMRTIADQYHIRSRAQVIVANQPWYEFMVVAQDERADLVVVEWPYQLDALRISLGDALKGTSCNIAFIRGPVIKYPQKLLVALRGGPFAELGLRLSLAIAKDSPSTITSLHLTSTEPNPAAEAAFQGLAKVLAQLPEIDQRETETDDPASVLIETSRDYDLLIMGATARPVTHAMPIGPVAERALRESPAGVVIVKTARPFPADISSETSGSAAISILVDKWFAENTYHASEFADLNKLVALKHKHQLSISLALPALNEEKTVGNLIQTIQSALVGQIPLLDEIVLVDSDSTDRTREIAASLGIPVYIHQKVLPAHGARKGKGEALWKSLYLTKGDIVVWIDTDIVNIHPRFVYGLIGPLLSNPQIEFVKGFYRRPLRVGNKIQAGGGGRVTELTARPLINLFYPELSGIIQPLSGEYGGRRSALERLTFFSGYGVEIGLLIDMLEKCGLSSIAQVDLEERIHHNQSLEALSMMAFAIIQVVSRKLERRFGRSILEEVNKTMKLIRHEPGRFYLDVEEISEQERPPIIELQEYRQRHSP